LIYENFAIARLKYYSDVVLAIDLKSELETKLGNTARLKNLRLELASIEGMMAMEQVYCTES
jgi:hypothetical protein